MNKNNVRKHVRIKILKQQNEEFQTVGLEFYLLFQSKSARIFNYPIMEKYPHLCLLGDPFNFVAYITNPGFSMMEKNLEFGEYNDAGKKHKTNLQQNTNKEFLFKLNYGLENDQFCQKNAFFIILQNKQTEINNLLNSKLDEVECIYQIEMLKKGFNKYESFITIIKKFNFGLNNITFTFETNINNQENSEKQKYVVRLFFAMGKILHGKPKNFEGILLNLSIFEQQMNYFEDSNLNEPEKVTFKLSEGPTNILEPNILDKKMQIYETLLRYVNLIKKIEQNSD